MKREIIGAQGEITIFRVTGEMPAGVTEHTDRDRAGRSIISHSESGHHHVLDRPAKVFEQTDAPTGMRILWALLEEPNTLKQDADDPHGEHQLDAGLYEMRIAREYDPFTEQARIVAD